MARPPSKRLTAPWLTPARCASSRCVSPRNSRVRRTWRPRARIHSRQARSVTPSFTACSQALSPPWVPKPVRGITRGTRLRQGNRRAIVDAATTIDADQPEVASALAHGAAGDVRRFHLVNAMAATISPKQAADLRARPDVLAVVPDLPLRLPRREPRDTSVAGLGAAPAVMPPRQVCPANPADPLLEPEALQLMNVAFHDDAQPGASDLARGRGGPGPL